MTIDEDDFLLISGIQHFSYCKRQWALIHVEQQWTENMLTTQGKIQHNRVHDSEIIDKKNGIYTLRSLKVCSKQLGVTGECDAVELIPVDNGICLNGFSGQWKLMPIEYKHGKSKINDCDRLQVTLQCLCLEEMFCCEIKEAAVFYFTTRRREMFEITDSLRQQAIDMVQEMHLYMNRGYVPKVKKKNICNNCSLINVCNPTIYSDSADVYKYIEKYILDE